MLLMLSSGLASNTIRSARLPDSIVPTSLSNGYVPLSIEMMLVRYWLAHGQPKSIQLLPCEEDLWGAGRCVAAAILDLRVGSLNDDRSVLFNLEQSRPFSLESLRREI